MSLKKSNVFLFFVFLLLLCPVTVYAEEPTRELGFTVKAELPENQIEKTSSFFNLLMEEEPQTVEVSVISTREEPVTVNISVSDGGTSDGGQIVYEDTKKNRDHTLVESVTDLVSANQKKVTVEKFETKKISFTIQPRKKEIQGARIGALSFMAATNGKKEGLSSVYGYRVGIVLMEEDTFYKDGDQLNFLKVRPNLSNGRKVIEAQLQNPQAKILENLEIETKLTEKGSSKILKQEKVSEMRVAPNSHFNFQTNWGLEPFKAGTYLLHINAKSGEKTWKWTKEFTINSEQATKMEKKALYKFTSPNWVIYLAITMIVLTLSLFSYLFFRRKISS